MIVLHRFLQLRDGAIPATPEELVELVAYQFRSQCAKLEQAEAQRRKPTVQQRRDMERDAARLFILTVEKSLEAMK